MPDHRATEVQATRSRARILDPIALLVLVPLLVPLVVLVALSYWLLRGGLYLAIWLLWCTRGKHILFTYSCSPNWQSHIEQELLPRLPVEAIILNWSERKLWSRWSLAANAFRHFLGDREHTPSAIIFRPFQRALIFRFHEAYLEAKHGNSAQLEKLEGDFLAACQAL